MTRNAKRSWTPSRLSIGENYSSLYAIIHMAIARKVDIAKQYLEDSLRLYGEGRFFSALTLAGAAEEMLGKSLQHTVPTGTGGVSLNPATALEREALAMLAFDEQLIRMGAPNFTAKSVLQLQQELVAPRNSAKHFNNMNESTFGFDQQFEAGSMIIRAIRNYRIVFPDAGDHYDCEEQDISADQLNKLNPFGRSTKV